MSNISTKQARAFSIIEVPLGENIIAGKKSTLILTSSDGSVDITGTAATKTIDFIVDTSVTDQSLAEVLVVGQITGGTDLDVSVGDQINVLAGGAFIDINNTASNTSRMRWSGGTGNHDMYVDPVNGDILTISLPAVAGNPEFRMFATGAGSFSADFETNDFAIGTNSAGNPVHTFDSGGGNGTITWNNTNQRFVFNSTLEVTPLTPAGFVTNDGSGVLGTQATIDISADTNLAVTSPITLTGDTIGFDVSANFLWTGTHDFALGLSMPDNQATTYGTGGDGTVLHDSSNLIIKGDVVGSGEVQFDSNCSITSDGDLFMDTDGVVVGNANLTRVHLECGVTANSGAGTHVALGFAATGATGLATPVIIGAFGFGVASPDSNHNDIIGVQGLSKQPTGVTGTTLRNSCFKALGLFFGNGTDGRGYWSDASVLGTMAIPTTLTDWYGFRADNVNSGGAFATLVNQYGLFTEALTAGTTLNYGVFITSATTAAFASGSDNIAGGILLGASQNFSLLYDGTNAFLNPRVVGSGNLTIPANVFIDGQADEEQLVVQGNGTQTSNIFVVEDSAGNDVFSVGATEVETFIYPDYVSVTTDANSNASAAEFNVFDEDNYAAFASTANLTAKGITFTQSTGVFDIEEDGKYVVQCCFTASAAAATLVSFKIKVATVEVFNKSYLVHSVVDPTERTVKLILDLTAGQDVEFFMESDTATLVTAQQGTTCNIFQIAS